MSAEHYHVHGAHEHAVEYEAVHGPVLAQYVASFTAVLSTHSAVVSYQGGARQIKPLPYKITAGKSAKYVASPGRGPPPARIRARLHRERENVLPTRVFSCFLNYRPSVKGGGELFHAHTGLCACVWLQNPQLFAARPGGQHHAFR